MEYVFKFSNDTLSPTREDIFGDAGMTDDDFNKWLTKNGWHLSLCLGEQFTGTEIWNRKGDEWMVNVNLDEGRSWLIYVKGLPDFLDFIRLYLSPLIVMQNSEAMAADIAKLVKAIEAKAVT
ncbi:MAG: hypothetical protein ACR2RE_20520 [Geminicoccaceae bacterium]